MLASCNWCCKLLSLRSLCCCCYMLSHLSKVLENCVYLFKVFFFVKHTPFHIACLTNSRMCAPTSTEYTCNIAFKLAGRLRQICGKFGLCTLLMNSLQASFVSHISYATRLFWIWPDSSTPSWLQLIPYWIRSSLNIGYDKLSTQKSKDLPSSLQYVINS